MRNPYTKEPIAHHAPPLRERMDYAFFVVTLVGAAYVVAYVWPWGGWSLVFSNSAQAIGFVYFFVGGYAFARSRTYRAEGRGGTNVALAAALIPISLWDIASVFVLAPGSTGVVVLHLMGGGVVLGLSLSLSIAFRRRTREAARPARL